MKRGDFIISVKFAADDGVVQLGADDNIYVEPAQGSSSVELTPAKLRLISLLQAAEDEVVEEDE